MFSLRSSAAAVGIIAILAVAPQPSLAQPSNVDDCNQPMPDAIAYVTLGRQPPRPHISGDGCWIFVNAAGGLAVLRRRGGVIEQHRVLDVQGLVRGLTHDGKILVLATTEVIFVDVERLLAGDEDVILGRDSDPHFGPHHLMGLTTMDNYLFLVQNETDWVSVINLNKVRAGAPGDAIVGGFATGWNVHLTLSADERYLYVSGGQGGGGGQVPAPPCTLTGDPLEEREGTILVVDVERAKADPGSAVIGGIRAACGGGMATSPDGAYLYLADRLGDSLLVFDAKRLVAGDTSALIARVPVSAAASATAAAQGSGAAVTTAWTNWPGPTDVAVIDSGRKLVVKSLHHLTVIDAQQVQRGAGAILGKIPVDASSGTWRWMAVPTPDQKTLVVETGSGLAIVDVDRLPLEPVKPH